MTQQTRQFSLKVLTINTHKGFTAFNRRFILPELRDAVRTVSADIVCLQEVMGAHEVHPLHVENWPDTTHYEFLADAMWSDYAYGRNAVYRKAITVTPCFLVFLSNTMRTATCRLTAVKNAACSIVVSCRLTLSGLCM
jgi:endonuclease/exonuclease/phosphatase family metal-dependent hydrolase